MSPIYPFKCPACGHTKDYQFNNTTAASRAYLYCTECDPDQPMERIGHAANFVVKGYSAKNGYSKKDS